MKIRTGNLIMGLLVLAPALLLVFENIKDWLNGQGFEPIEDNVIGYIVLLIVFGAAAASMAIYHGWKGARHGLTKDLLRYAISGAAGPLMLLLAADAADDYFSGSGIGWIWPLAGLLLGSAYGAIFRASYGLLILRRESG